MLQKDTKTEQEQQQQLTCVEELLQLPTVPWPHKQHK